MRAPDPHTDWSPWTVPEVATALDGFPGRWWLSGGVALDRFLGYASRPHGDIDISVALDDRDALLARLRRVLDLHGAVDGSFHPLGSPAGRRAVNIWGRDRPAGLWRLQVNVEEVTDGVWHYRRDRRVHRPAGEVIGHTGVPTVAPAVQLLWKAKSPQPKDDADLDAVLPRLATAERHWLAESVRLSHPDSPWGPRL